MSEPSTIQVVRLANVDYVTLNRPEVRNAFNEHLIAEMTSWAEGAAKDPGAKESAKPAETAKAAPVPPGRPGRPPVPSARA